jgi:serine/threonine protein kinase
MRCLSIQDFNKKYKLGSIMGKGAYGEVYQTSDNLYIIKKQNVSEIDAFARESVLLSQFRHPNLIHIEDISFTNEYVYFSQPRGIPLRQAMNENLINIKNITTDLFSAFSFLYVNSIAHCDLKPENIIFHDGKIKIIDFGLAKIADLCELNGKVDLYIKNVSYTEPFRDPEYDFEKYSPICVELYSIATTLYYLLINRYYSSYYKRDFYIGEEQWNKIGINDREFIDLMTECQLPLTQRKSILDLLNHPYLIQSRLIKPQKLFLPVAQLKEKGSIMVKKILNMGLLFGYNLQSILNTLNLYISLVDSQNHNITHSGDGPFDLIYACACMLISASIYDYQNDVDLETFKAISKYITPNTLSKAYCDIYTQNCGFLIFDSMYRSIKNDKDIENILTSMAGGYYVSSDCYINYTDQRSVRHNMQIVLKTIKFYEKQILDQKHISTVECEDYPVPLNDFSYIRQKIQNLQNIHKKEIFNIDLLEFVMIIIRYRKDLENLNHAESVFVLDILQHYENLSNNTELIKRVLGLTNVNYQRLKKVPYNIFALQLDIVKAISQGQEYEIDPSIL